MSGIIGMMWGILTIAVMGVTFKYYIPRLEKRICDKDTKALTEKRSCGRLLGNKYVSVCILSVGGVFGAACGYFVQQAQINIITATKLMIVFFVLCGAFVTDMELWIIPNLYPLLLIASRVGLLVFEIAAIPENALGNIMDSIISLAVSTVLLLAAAKMTGGGIGMGDIKLFAGIGFMCGMTVLCFTLVFAFFICSVVSAALLITKKMKLKDALPLGPFIWLGYGASILLLLN
uniref:prepilin peptidase n=1 Tax=Agathobacter sp. TaxID=2021311 RepID=UPI004056D012